MIELVNPKTHAVIPDPHVNAIFLFGLILFFLKIDINSSFFLKVRSLSFISSVKGIFFEPSMFPLLNSFLASGCSPKNLSLPRASISSNDLFLILLIIWSLFKTNDVFS